MAAIGMFSGYCGTLIDTHGGQLQYRARRAVGVPDKNAVIKAQLPTALMMLVVNIVLL